MKRIEGARRTECRGFLKLYCLKGFSEGFFRNFNIILSFPVVLLPLAEGRPLLASSVFTALTIIDILTFNVMLILSLGGNAAAEYYSVIKRVQNVLLLEEKEELPPP